MFPQLMQLERDKIVATTKETNMLSSASEQLEMFEGSCCEKQMRWETTRDWPKLLTGCRYLSNNA